MDVEKSLKHIEKVSQQAVEYFSERSNLEKIGKITAISVATYVVANVCYLMLSNKELKLTFEFRNCMMHF
jgi:hypothetical protein